MSCATVLGGVGGEGSAGAAEAVVECDGGGECGEAGEQPHAEVSEGAGAVTLEREEVLAGLKDRLDPLADRREVWAAATLVFAPGAHDLGVEFGEFGLEVLAAEVLIADQDEDLPGLTLTALDELQAHELLVDLWRCQRQRPRGAVQRENRVQPETPEETGMAGAISVVGGVGKRVSETGGAAALDGLAAASTLHRRGVDQQEIVIEPGAVARELADQRFDRPGQAQPALMKRGPLGQAREQVPELAASGPQEPFIARDPHHRLSYTERDDLRVGDPSPCVSWPGRQEIISHAVNSDQQQIEVGVHRGPPKSRRSVLSTADFDLPAYNPSPQPTTTPTAVAQLI